MDRNTKFLKKLSQSELAAIDKVLTLILERKVYGLDIKKLSGYKDVYRVRVGHNRIIFLDNSKDIEILLISRRSDTTYNVL